MKPIKKFPIKFDIINRARHYNVSPSGVECIEVIEHMNFCLGSAMKYIWRAGEKDGKLQDLQKARYYIDREIKRLTKADNNTV
jgi:hypothetical protein